MADIQTIEAKVKTELEKLKWSGQPFVDVFDYHTQGNDWYPFASFEMTEYEWQVRDNCNTVRNLTFEIYIIQEFEKVTRQEAKNILYKAMDDIMLQFDKNYTLGWEVEFAQPIWGSIVPFNVANWPALVATMNLLVRYEQFIK